MAKGQTRRDVRKWAGTENRREWRDALRLELSRADGPSGRAIERIARLVVHNALNGDLDCINEIANRLDGKPSVSIDPTTEAVLEKMVVQWGGIVSGPPMKTIEGSTVKKTN